ncbi:phosphonate ABC transporter, permease protein PhnE [Haloquadratum walsbyi]|jgi:phosphonate ABC transporter, permease protein PhnE|uniref:Phosphonate ABC transporter, permease protein PhnE n=1 Tax=Haloquadratum walsbyi J07HQW2 TaxID=1238425 RepID=U1PNN0_9EURY|nr:phosphonate ABC transporter, permease protein PhnE [Haloquadratum walsbyi]ERG95347.1 MAG: phosphonate ABC transporter, permease protein PhnE [Haloquadratum walsbyi J07HQW2]
MSERATRGDAGGNTGDINESTSVDTEFRQHQQQWRRQFVGRVVIVVSLVILVIAVARWLGFDIGYLYAHRGNLWSVLAEEMLAPEALLTQLQGDAGMLVPAAAETLAIAAVGTALGLPIALCLGTIAANTVTPRWVHMPVRLLLGGVRAVPSMVYALLFVILAGLGPVAGALAIAVGSIGDLGRLFADEMEEINEQPIEAVQSSGASAVSVTAAARLPQVKTAYIAWTLFYLEINARKSSVLGIVGAGGLGFPLIMAFRARNYTRVMAVILAILILIITVETTANRLRERFRSNRRADQ